MPWFIAIIYWFFISLFWSYKLIRKDEMIHNIYISNVPEEKQIYMVIKVHGWYLSHGLLQVKFVNDIDKILVVLMQANAFK